MESSRMNLRFIRSLDDKLHRWKVQDFVIALLAASALLALLLIWPLGAMKDTVVSSSGAEFSRYTGEITDENVVAQTFIPQHAYIRKLGVLLDRDNENSYMGDFYLEIFDAAGNSQRKVFSKIFRMKDKAQGYHELPINLKVIPGASYIIQISTKYTEGQPIKLAYRGKNSAGPVENQLLYYAGQVIPDASLACSYSYGAPMGKKQILAFYTFFLALFFIARALVLWMAERRYGLRQELSLSVAGRLVVSFVIGWVWLFSLYYALIRKAFGGELGDYLIYGVGLCVALCVGLTAVWSIKPQIDRIREISFPSVVRVIAFAVYFSLYAPYFNSGSNFGHYMNGSLMAVAFGVILLTMFTRKELVRWSNLIYTILFGIGAGIFMGHRIHGWSAEQRILYLRVGIAGWVWGLVLFLVISRLCRRQLQKVSIGFIVPVLLFFLLTCVFGHGKYWPVLMTISFLCLYLMKKEKTLQIKLLREFSYGAILSFWYEVVYCLLHRPYHRFTFSRYPMQFSSVAMTGLYIVFIFIAALPLLIEKIEQRKSWKDTWFYLLTEGVVLSYMVLSISRTSILTGIVIVVVIAALLWVIKGRNGLLRAVVMIGMLILSLLVTFPMTYTLTRCVPAVVDDPDMYPYEEFADRILAGEEKDSYRYMNVRQYTELVFGRIAILRDGNVNLEAFDESPAEQTTESGNESSDELTNGRLAIAKMYWKRLNWTGHDSVVINVGDTIYAHAHNTFIQVAYDHGILCGIVFLILGLVAWIRSVLYIRHHYESGGAISMLPMLMLTTFAITAVAEYVFLPVIPLGFGILFVIDALMIPFERE